MDTYINEIVVCVVNMDKLYARHNRNQNICKYR